MTIQRLRTKSRFNAHAQGLFAAIFLFILGCSGIQNNAHQQADAEQSVGALAAAERGKIGATNRLSYLFAAKMLSLQESHDVITIALKIQAEKAHPNTSRQEWINLLERAAGQSQLTKEQQDQYYSQLVGRYAIKLPREVHSGEQLPISLRFDKAGPSFGLEIGHIDCDIRLNGTKAAWAQIQDLRYTFETGIGKGTGYLSVVRVPPGSHRLNCTFTLKFYRAGQLIWQNELSGSETLTIL